MIRDAGRAARRSIPARILLTQTDAVIMTTSYRELLSEFGRAAVSRLRTELVRRARLYKGVDFARTNLE